MFCKDCEHFSRRVIGVGRADAGECYNTEKFIYLPDGWLERQNIKADSLMYWDSEGYGAHICVGENFGCIHFKQREYQDRDEF